jgi:hypothetical protein
LKKGRTYHGAFLSYPSLFPMAAASGYALPRARELGQGDAWVVFTYQRGLRKRKLTA